MGTRTLAPASAAAFTTLPICLLPAAAVVATSAASQHSVVPASRAVPAPVALAKSRLPRRVAVGREP